MNFYGFSKIPVPDPRITSYSYSIKRVNINRLAKDRNSRMTFAFTKLRKSLRAVNIEELDGEIVRRQNSVKLEERKCEFFLSRENLCAGGGHEHDDCADEVDIAVLSDKRALVF